MKPYSRREFLSKSLSAAAAVGAAGALQGCPEAPATPVNPTDVAARVCTIRGRDLAEMTRQVLAQWGGAETIINPGETVFIKLNLMSAGLMSGNIMTRGECTKLEIVIAAAEECLKAGAGKVVIGDAAQVDRFSWDTITTLDGTVSFTEEAQRLNTLYGDKVQLACLGSDSPAWIEIPSPYTNLGTIRISSLVMDADKIISIPVMKTHMFTKVTFSIKNMLGVTPALGIGIGPLKSRMDMHAAAGGIEQSFLDVVTALKPNFAIIDGSLCCEGNGPGALGGFFSNRVDMRERLGDFVLMASDDLVAADATASRMIGQDPAKVKHLRLAYEQGLGQMQEDLIEVEGESLDSLLVEWKEACLAKSLPPGVENIPPYNCLKFSR
ncbi:MAG TPA: DUF362 domain-containing protein [Candidatus Hydrogenedentes bacterium]|nr:DUF362 domain-containing protein [Candidatus Hydrogenedentota bacterium]